MAIEEARSQKPRKPEETQERGIPRLHWLPRLPWLLLFVFLLRLPFLTQAIQGDDVYYLAAAEHAQIEPLHPNHARFVFVGDIVDMRGHPHPPLDGWTLGLLLAIFGDVREAPFHAAYILFSLIAAVSVWSLARRFSPRPVLATLLFLATPTFVVNGNSFEADLPFVAFWLAATALFIRAVDSESAIGLAWPAVAMVLAAMAAYQAILLAPILAVYLWWNRRKFRPAWVFLLAAPATVIAWQLFERWTSGSLPAMAITGYGQAYHLHSLANKLRNAAALTAHTGWLIFPALAVAAFRKVGRTAWIVVAAATLGAVCIDPNPLFWASFGAGLLLLAYVLRSTFHDRDFLSAWILIFFASALILFFAGSARYLLPIAAPVALLATRLLENRPRWLAAGFALGLLVSLSLSIVNYQHWDGYRRFACSIEKETAGKRVWINGEWGLRYYFEAQGGLALRREQAIAPGEMLVTSRLAYPIPVTTGGGMLTPVSEREISSPIPLRLIGLDARSAYSSDAFGLRPFDICRRPIDVVSAAVVVERKPSLSDLPMNHPAAAQQIVSGIFQLEENRWRWTSGRAVVLLKNPGEPLPLKVAFFIPPSSPARRVTVQVDGRMVADETYAVPGLYTISTSPLSISGQSATVVIAVDKTFAVPGDQRPLGIILTEVGFRSL